MRKLLLLCAMLLSGIGAWAEDVFVMPETGKYYKLKGDNQDKPWLTKQLNSNSIVVSANEAEAAIFMKTENGFIEITTGKYLGMNGSVVSLVTSATTVTIGDHNDGNVTGNGTKYSVKVANNYMYNNNTDGKTHESSGWITNIERYWGFIEEKGFVVTIEGGTSGQHRGFLAAGEGYPNYPVLSGIEWTEHSGKSTTAISGGKYWYIHKINENDTYVLFNLGLQKYLVLESDESNEYINFGDYPYAWKIVQNTSDSNYKAVCLWNGSKQISFACGYTGAERNVRPHNQMGDGGSKHSIKYYLPAELGDFSDAINAINKVKNEVASLNNVSVPMTFTLVDNASNEHSYTGAGELYPLISGVEDYVMQTPVWNGNTFNADITFPVPVSSETVSNPTFISTYNYSEQPKDQFKWYASEKKIKVKEGEEIYSSSIASHLWLIYPKLNNGKFTFQIKNVATDLFINSTASVSEHDNNSTVRLSGNATDFTVGKRDNEGAEFINSNEMRLSVNTSMPNEGDIQTVGTHSSHHGTALTFRKPGFNVTIGATGYATLYSPITVFQAPEEKQLEIYQIESAAKNGRIELTQMYHVYKNQGVILKGESGTYSFALTEDYWEGWIEESMWDNNKLKGSFTNTYVEGDAYVLSKPTIGGIVQEVGLYKAELNKNENGEDGTTHFKNNAGKAYLPASEAASDARFLVFNFGDDMETGITETENGNVNAENDEVYDLAGRRVQNAQKGIFIVNGKMVVR